MRVGLSLAMARLLGLQPALYGSPRASAGAQPPAAYFQHSRRTVTLRERPLSRSIRDCSAYGMISRRIWAYFASIPVYSPSDKPRKPLKTRLAEYGLVWSSPATYIGQLLDRRLGHGQDGTRREAGNS